MEKTNDAEISLLDAPVGAVVDLVSWGNLSQEDIRKLTDVGIYLDLPLTVSSVKSLKSRRTPALWTTKRSWALP